MILDGERWQGTQRSEAEDHATERAWGSGHLGPGCEQQVSAPVGTQKITLRKGRQGTVRKTVTPKQNGEPPQYSEWAGYWHSPIQPCKSASFSFILTKGDTPAIQSQPFTCDF